MRALTEEAVRKFAEENFKKLQEYLYGWNILHVTYMIKAIEVLAVGDDIDINRLKTLAWVHDIGKIESEENHAEFSIKILEKEFDLSLLDRDCILNHGASKKPVSKEAKIFQKADGISLFYPEIVLYRFWAEAKEGTSFKDVTLAIEKQYKKYLDAYSDDPKAVDMLTKRYHALF